MVKFSDEHKAEPESNYFAEGVHKVKISGVEFDETEKGQPYAEFTVVDETGNKEDSVRMWFTTDKAINYTFNIIRGIFVHNAPADRKDEMRDAIDALEDTDALEAACQKHLIGKECWFKVEKDPSRTYPGRDGTPKPSFNKNIYGYNPQPETATVPNEGVEDFPVDKPADKSDDKPKKKTVKSPSAKNKEAVDKVNEPLDGPNGEKITAF